MINVGELFIVGFDSLELDEKIKHLIHEYRIGGVILFNRNIKSVQQLQKLTGDLQKEAILAGYTQPLLICLDQENGSVRRINQGITLFPGAMALAAANDVQLTEAVHFATGSELAQLGINWNLSPVADINSNSKNPIIGVRSFGDNSCLAIPHIASAMRGMQQAGVLTCLKHFPGHGDTNIDSHLALPVVDKSYEQLKAVELSPYQKLIDEVRRIDTIMISHILFPQLSPQPASLSPEIIRGILRKDLGYNGVITTDCLEMAAISEGVGVRDGAYQALLAGNDLVMISHTYKKQLAALDYIQEKMLTDSLFFENVVESQKRVENLKNNLSDVNKLKENTRFHEKLAEEAYNKSITVHKDSGKRIDKEKKVAVVFPNNKQQLRVEDIHESFDLPTLFSSLNTSIECFFYEKEMLIDEIEKLEEVLSNFEQIIFCTLNISDDDSILKIINTIEPSYLSLICLKNPYDLQLISLAKFNQVVLAYEPSPHVLKFSVDSLIRPQVYQGKLPVTI